MFKWQKLGYRNLLTMSRFENKDFNALYFPTWSYSERTWLFPRLVITSGLFWRRKGKKFQNWENLPVNLQYFIIHSCYKIYPIGLHNKSVSWSFSYLLSCTHTFYPYSFFLGYLTPFYPYWFSSRTFDSILSIFVLSRTFDSILSIFVLFKNI